MKYELDEVSKQPFILASYEVSNITKNLIQTHKMFQGIASNLRKVSKELLFIQDNLEPITNDRNLLPLAFVK